MIVESRIAKYLDKRGIMQSRLAEYIGMDRSRLNLILKGKASMTADQYGLACEFLEKEPNFFFRNDEDIEQSI